MAQQTLYTWRIEEDSTDSGSTDNDDDESQGQAGGKELRPPLQTRQKQTQLADFFQRAELTNATMSINGISSDNQDASSEESREDSSLDMNDQPTAGCVQPSAEQSGQEPLDLV